MSLEETLKELGIEGENVEKIKSLVGELVESQSSESVNALKELQAKHKELEEELAPFKKDQRFNQIKTLLPETANSELFEDIVLLSGISDEDDEDSIKTKLNDAVSNREYLQKPKTKDSAATGDKSKVEVEKEDNKDEEEEKSLENL